jgi:hypothetical protein
MIHEPEEYNISIKFFKDDPVISWTKVFCPICSAPSGSKSECYKNPPKNQPKIISQNGLPLPLYSTNCAFRSDNLWEIDVNYPVSEILLDKINDIQGIDRAFPTKKYTFQIVIAKNFEEKVVKNRVNEVFKTFIKEMQARESSMIPTNQEKKYGGIKFPNGEVYLVDSSEDEDSLIDFLLKEFPRASGILRDQ